MRHASVTIVQLLWTRTMSSVTGTWHANTRVERSSQVHLITQPCQAALSQPHRDAITTNPC